MRTGAPGRGKKLFSRLLVLLFLLAVVAVALLVVFPAALFGAGGSPDWGSAGRGEARGLSADRDRVNLVLLGFDGFGDSSGLYRPDTILVASIDLRSASVNMVSIPRDSFVEIYGAGLQDKINHSFMHGYYMAGGGEDPSESGLHTTLHTIDDFLGGVPLHGYLLVYMDGAAAIVDSMGGVYLDVESEVRADFGRGDLLVGTGYQHLDGKKFMYYVRDRTGHRGGEYGRTTRQQQGLAELLGQFRKPSRLAYFPRFVAAAGKHVQTDLNPVQTAALGLLALRVNTSSFGSYVFSGWGQLSYRNGQNIWYLLIDEAERVRIIEEAFGVSVPKRTQLSLPGPVVPEPDIIEPPPEPLLPDPDPEPVPDPEPPPVDPDPDPAPDPGPDPVEPDPDPVPAPDPDPVQPDPDPLPDPVEPEPLPDPVPDPEPVPAPEEPEGGG